MALPFVALAVGGCGARLVVVSEPGASPTQYVLSTVDSMFLPAPVCSSGTTCGTVIQSGSLTIMSRTTVRAQERFGPLSLTTDSTVDRLLMCQCDSTFVMIQHDFPIRVDTGFIHSGQLQLLAWRGPRRHEFVYQRSP